MFSVCGICRARVASGALRGSCPVSGTTAGNVGVLTLTYGDRVDMLERMVEAVAREGVRHILVMANGLAPGPLARLRVLRDSCAARELRLDIHQSPENLGSSRGFGHLLRVARAEAGLQAVWFMDDDNIPLPGALARLLEAHRRHPGAALAAVRLDRSYLIRAASTGVAEAPPAGQVFHVDLSRGPRRLLERLGLLPQAEPGPHPVPAEVPVYRAPYGGLFVPRARIEDTDPPREAFVLYADDYEYTARLAGTEGLYLVGAARIEDQEASWNATGAGPWAQRSQFARLATMPPDFRLYYSIRNAVHLDRQRAAAAGASARALFWVNAAAFLVHGCLHALATGSPTNAWALWNATTDGIAGRLGPAPAFPLP